MGNTLSDVMLSQISAGYDTGGYCYWGYCETECIEYDIDDGQGNVIHVVQCETTCFFVEGPC